LQVSREGAKTRSKNQEKKAVSGADCAAFSDQNFGHPQRKPAGASRRPEAAIAQRLSKKLGRGRIGGEQHGAKSLYV
jgi:hypothetical protein